jgi:hypothetical protein
VRRHRLAQTGCREKGENGPKPVPAARGPGGLYFLRVSDMLNHSFWKYGFKERVSVEQIR